MRGAFRPVVLAVSATATLVAFGQTASAAEPTRFATLSAAVSSGAVAQGLAASASAGRSTRAFVDFAYADVVNAGGLPPRGNRARASALSTTYGARKREAFRLVPGVRVLHDYANLPTTFVEVPTAAALLELANNPFVIGVRAARMYRAQLTQSLPLIRQPQAAAAGATGQGTAVAVLDTGADFANPAFGSCPQAGAPGCRVVVAQDFAPDDASRDDDGHGTNVSGIVAGVAPRAQILALDVFRRVGDFIFVVEQDALAALDFAYANQAVYNIRAVNLSFGTTEHFTSECTDSVFAGSFATARSLGILPVVSSGNAAFVNGQYVDGVHRPACTAGAVSVGAVYDSNVGSQTLGEPPHQCTDQQTAADQVACFSQSGPLLSMLAPGAFITAAGITAPGTSQAAPHVAGSAAALASRGPTASADGLQQALASSGPELLDARNGTRRHRIDLLDALNRLTAPPNRPPICSGVRANPTLLWPPDHTLRLVTLAGTTDPDGDSVTLTITGVTQDEPVDGAPDAQAGPAPNMVFLRAERSAKGDGRVYRINFAAVDAKGGRCAGTTTVGVPHDRRKQGQPIDSAPPSYNSFEP